MHFTIVMGVKSRLRLLLLLNIFMGLAVYFFAYFFSIFAVSGGPFFWFCNAGGFIIAYAGLGRIKDYFLVALRNNETELTEFLSKLQFKNENGSTFADPFKNFKKYAAMSIIAILLFGLFDLVFYFWFYQSDEFKKSEETLNTLFFTFSIIGAIIGISPIRDRLKYFWAKHTADQNKTVGQLIEEETLKQKLKK